MAEQNQLLIIDDDSRNVFALSAVLRAKGFDVVSASSAQAGLALLHRNKGINLVLLDMMMPEMDGYETLAQIRRNPELNKRMVIAVTAQAMKGDREKCLEAGADGYLSKPIDVDLLLEMLQKHKQGGNDQGR